MHSAENWDHLRYLLAVAEAGSVSKAARNLGVNHATVLRHVAAFEDNAGAAIFEKSATGYAVLGDRLRVIDAVKDVEAAVQAVKQIVNGSIAPVRGVVRVTSTDAFCQILMPPIIQRCRNQLDGLYIELMSTNSRLDLSRLGADITLRPAVKLEDDLQGEIASKLAFAAYSAQGANPSRWLTLAGSLQKSEIARWMSKNIHFDEAVASADSFLALREMAAIGLGKTILPCFIGDTDSRLTRIGETVPDLDVSIWIANHVDLENVPRIKAVREFLVQAVGEQSDRLEGNI
ncbi:MAG: LysR family transcriptional regulator [Paracoccaceae bacterium]